MKGGKWIRRVAHNDQPIMQTHRHTHDNRTARQEVLVKVETRTTGHRGSQIEALQIDVIVLSLNSDG